MTTRAVSNYPDPLISPNGALLANTQVIFQLVDLAKRQTAALFDAADGGYIAGTAVTATTDSQGMFTVNLWPNSRGEFATCYKVSLPDTLFKPFYIQVSEGSGPLPLLAARTNMEALVPQTQTVFEGLLASITAALGTATSVVTQTVNGLMTYTDKVKLDGISGTNTGDETLATIKTKLGVTTLSGANTGDQDLSGLAPLYGANDIRHYMDGQSGRPTLAAWLAAEATVDVSAAFTALVAAVPADGGTILLPAGHTYYAPAGLLINRSTVEATGGGKVVGPFILQGTSSAQVKDIRVIGMKVAYPSITAGKHGVEFEWCSGAKIADCAFENTDKTYYYRPINTVTFQPSAKTIIHGNETRYCNYDLYVDNYTGTKFGVVGDVHYTNNVVKIAYYTQFHAVGLDGIVCIGNTMFFDPSHTTRLNNIYIDYYDWAIIKGNNLFEAGRESILLGHGHHANVEGNNIAWPGQVVASSAIRFFGGDTAGQAFTLGSARGNIIMYPTKHGIEIDALSGYISLRDNDIWAPGDTSHYIGVEDVAAMAHNYIEVDPAAPFVTSMGNTGAAKSGALFNLPGASQLSKNDAISTASGVTTTTLGAGLLLTLSGTETSINPTGAYMVHLNQSAPATITSISAGVKGQALVLFAYNGNTTLAHNDSTLKLSGRANALIPQHHSITLVWNPGSAWWEEVSRTFRIGQVVLTAPDMATTIDVAGSSGQNVTGVNLNYTGTATVTAITGGLSRQEVTLYAFSGNTTIQSNSGIRLAQAQNATIPAYGSLTLVYDSGSSWWWEKSRNFSAPTASPALTGTPTAPTAAADTNTTQLATTAFVLGQAASSTPAATAVGGTGVVGSSKRYATADHAHPKGDASTLNGFGSTQSGASSSCIVTDASGHIALGAAASAWSTAYRVIEFGGGNALFSTTAGLGGFYTAFNGYYDGTNWRYKNTGILLHTTQNTSGFSWYSAASGTAGAAASISQTMNLDVSGNLWIAGSTATKASGTTWANPSDRRLKDGIINYVRGLNELNQLTVREWVYNGKGGTLAGVRGVGVIADEAETVLPEVVSTYVAKLDAEDAAPSTIKKVESSDIFWLMLKSIQELSAKVTDLEARLNG